LWPVRRFCRRNVTAFLRLRERTNATQRSRNAPCSLIHFRRQTQIKLDLPLCLGAFPPTCALRKHNPKNSSRNLVEQKPDNAIPVALRGLSARKQEVNTSRTVNVFLMHVCIFMYACVWKSHNPVDTTDFFKIKRNT